MNDAIVLLLASHPEHVARAIVAELSPPSTLQAFDRVAATKFARKLLDSGLERRSIAFRLSARYDIAIPSAYRRIGEAMAMGKKASQAQPAPSESVSPTPGR